MIGLVGDTPEQEEAESGMDQVRSSETAAAERTVLQCLADVQAEEREGELFRAYDLALRGLEQHPDDLTLKHRAVLCLASTGATRQARAKYRQMRLDAIPAAALAGTPRRLGMDIATLDARLTKDEAFGSTGEVRQRLLADAAELYEAIYRVEKKAGNKEAYYPAVNAATLRLLSGQGAAAARLARATLEELAAWPAKQRDYYELASMIEAYLVLGDVEPARDLAQAMVSGRSWTTELDFRALSSTLRQLHLIVAVRGLDATWLDGIAPPRVIHYLGHIISAPGGRGRFPAAEEQAVKEKVAIALDASAVGFGYGSLAAGADILFAEALIERGASLNLVLPFNEEEFIDVSVRPASASWIARYHACREKAATIRFATEDRYLNEDRLFAYCSELAIGLALLRARHLTSEAEQIAVWDGQPARGPVGTAADIALWQRTGLRQTIIGSGDGSSPASSDFSTGDLPSERRTRAMLFGDIKGFSKLTDEELPRFTKVVLGEFARVIDLFGADVLLANTWGDGVFLVFDDAGKAASCALDLQEAMSAIDLTTAGLPLHLALRIGLHLGPIYAEHDPIKKQLNFFGAHVSRAARIEPVTPEGCVYVTETMAAVLAIHNSDRFVCEYVGITQMAKLYGQLRMFLLRRVMD